jgi:hypothetical protein
VSPTRDAGSKVIQTSSLDYEVHQSQVTTSSPSKIYVNTYYRLIISDFRTEISPIFNICNVKLSLNGPYFFVVSYSSLVNINFQKFI